MRTITWAAIVALVLCVPSLGQDTSTITYTLGLDGDNGAALYEASADFYPAFDTTSAVYSDDPIKTFDRDAVGADVTWHVEVAASGLQDALEINGAANMTFSLALWVGTDTDPETGTLAANVVYHSTIHDGVADGARGGAHGVEETHNASFCFIFDVGGNGPTANPGRVWDPYTNGGPLCDRIQYPSANGVADDLLIPLAVAVNAGTLVGMGAGYSEYAGSGCAFWGCGTGAGGNTAGIGMLLTGEGYDGLGNETPVFEGQMDTTALPEGTYTLALVALDAEGENISANVVKSNFDHDLENPGAFAKKAAVVVEDAITFVVTGGGVSCTKPVAQSVVSRKDHAGYTGDVVLFDGAPTDSTECRDLAAAGELGTMQIIVEYDIDIQAADGSLDAGGEVSLVCNPTDPNCNDYIASLDIVGNELIINLAGLPWEFPKTNGALTLDIVVDGIADAAASVPAPGSCIEGDPTYSVCILRGDVDASGSVTAVDLGIVLDPAVLFQSPSANPGNVNILRADIDRSDAVTAVDLGIVLDVGVLFAQCP